MVMRQYLNTVAFISFHGIQGTITKHESMAPALPVLGIEILEVMKLYARGMRASLNNSRSICPICQEWTTVLSKEKGLLTVDREILNPLFNHIQELNWSCDASLYLCFDLARARADFSLHRAHLRYSALHSAISVVPERGSNPKPGAATRTPYH